MYTGLPTLILNTTYRHNWCMTVPTLESCDRSAQTAVAYTVLHTKQDKSEHQKKFTRATGRSPDHSLPILTLADGLHQAPDNKKRTGHSLTKGQAVLHARPDPPCSLYTTHVCPHHMKPWARTGHSYE